MAWAYRKNARHSNPKKDAVRKAVCNKAKRKTKNEMAGWRVQGPEKDGYKRMERQSKGPKDLEAYCSGGQGPPRVVAPTDDDEYLQSVLSFGGMTLEELQWVRSTLEWLCISKSHLHSHTRCHLSYEWPHPHSCLFLLEEPWNNTIRTSVSYTLWRNLPHQWFAMGETEMVWLPRTAECNRWQNGQQNEQFQ